MSGDVQPRKRKDKKRKKDDLGVEEPRGTAAIFGEGDVFMHSHHDHGTGGHWCAKVIFFSLLAILVTLIGLIILENRGLTELEANSVESRYSGVLDGWLEDAPDHDHHDVHTLELKQHDGEEHDDDEENDNIEVERIEREVSEEGEEEPAPYSEEVVSRVENNINDKQSQEELSNEVDPEDSEDEEVEFLELDDDVPAVVEQITAPAGKPLVEVEEETSSEKPPDTLAEEEEYEKQQEELRRQKEESSHVWLKLVVGGALLVATHAVVRRATAPRDTSTSSERVAREETPINDRRMTLIPEEPPVHPAASRIVPQELSRPIIETEVLKSIPVVESATEPVEESEEEVEEEEEIEDIPIAAEEIKPIEEKDSEDKELYSDEDSEEEEVVEEKREVPKTVAPIQKEKTPEQAPDPDDVGEDVEIIGDEQLEDELEEEVEDEEDISDVDDAELLSRLEAKYGKLPAPERPGPNPSKDRVVCSLTRVATAVGLLT